MTHSNEKDWPCGHPQCTREAPFCDVLQRDPSATPPPIDFVQVPGSGFALCDRMVTLINNHTRAQQGNGQTGDGVIVSSEQKPLTPDVIAARLKEHIVGQDPALTALASFVYREVIAKANLRQNHDVMAQHNIQPENVKTGIGLIFGTTGSGKTMSLQLLQRLFNIPVALLGGVQNLTDGAWIGTKIDNFFGHAINQLVVSYKDMGDPKTPKQIIEGINSGQITPVVAIDEIDKIALKKSDGTGSNHQGEPQQNLLLPYLQGSTVEINVGDEKVTLDTTNIVFLLMGAFSTPNKDGKTLAQVVMPHKDTFAMYNPDTSETVDKNAIYEKAEIKHFLGWFIHQFIGRIRALIPFGTLGESILRSILSEPTGNLISVLRAEIETQGGQLVVQDEALDVIAQRAREDDTGARALEHELEKVVSTALYSLPSKIGEGLGEMFISRKMVEQNGAIIEEGENATFRPPSGPSLETFQAYPSLPAPHNND